MKEIYFRGKRIDIFEEGDSGWVIGYYINVEDFESHYDFPAIIPVDSDIYSFCEINELYYVDPDTVGQYIGLDDARGDMIFEGDILYNELRRIMIVVEDVRRIEHLYFHSKEYTIIGNVWDNPELIYERQ